MGNKRAISFQQLISTKFEVMDFEGDWLALMGKPELTGSWLVWGNSGNGKTYFATLLAKYLTKFGKVAYNSLEEGSSQSIKTAWQRANMGEVEKHIILIQEKTDDLRERLEKQKSPRIIIVDSLQYTGMTYKEYIQLREDFPKKLFVFLSHAEGKNPSGRVAKSVRYDSFIKIRVEGFKAFATSRYGGGKEFTIWNEGALNYWGS